VFKYSSRFWLYAPFGAFLLIAAATAAHWWIMTGAFEKKLAALKGHEVIPGVALDWRSVTLGGFPFRVDADFTGLSLQGAGPHGPFAWQTEKFAMHALTYGRPQNIYEAAGQQQVRWTDADGGAHQAAFLPASMRGSSIAGAQGLRRFDLDIVGMGGKDFAIGRFQFHMRRNPDGADLDLMLRTDAAGARKQVQIYATLSRAGSLISLLEGKTSLPEAHANWRAQGGKARLSQVVAPGLDAEKLLSPLY
jgi:hypothetical protein